MTTIVQETLAQSIEDKPKWVHLTKLLLSQPTFGPWLKAGKSMELNNTHTEIVICVDATETLVDDAMHSIIKARIYEFLLRQGYDLAIRIER